MGLKKKKAHNGPDYQNQPVESCPWIPFARIPATDRPAVGKTFPTCQSVNRGQTECGAALNAVFNTAFTRIRVWIQIDLKS